MVREHREFNGYLVIKESIDRATEYLHLRGFERITVLAASSLVLAVNMIMLLIAFQPLYVIKGRVVHGYIGIISYKLSIIGIPQRPPQLESLHDLSFLLIFAAVYSTILVLPSILYPQRRIPRIHLELAVAGYIVAELGLTLLASFLRIIQDNIIPSIPLDGSMRTDYGFFVIEKSSGHITRTGLIAIHMREYFIFIAVIFVLMSFILAVYIIEYYREVEDAAPLIPNPS
jgi:hypothetical protein